MRYNGKKFRFKECGYGLYYYNTGKVSFLDKNNLKSNCIQTVRDYESMYTRYDIKWVKLVTEMQQYYFWPSTDSVENYIFNNQLRNCTVTGDDAKTRNHIYGAPYQLLRRKMTREGPGKHKRSIIEKIPVTIAERYLKVHLFMDIYIFCKSHGIYTYKIGKY